MKRLIAAAAVMMATTAMACAGDTYSIDIGGHTIRIDRPKNCDDASCVSISIPGVFESGPKRGKRSKIDRDDDDYDDDIADKPIGNKPAQDARKPPVTPQAPPATTALPSTLPATTTPGVSAKAGPAPASPPVETRLPDAAPVAAPAKPADPVVATAPAAAPAAATTRPSTAAATTTAPAVAGPPSPLGLWWTEEKEGKIRIEACGDNICGYSVKKTDENGEKILINMKPTADNKWKGRIHDPKSGSDYDSTIALNGSDRLKVQGCAFGGMFCGGQVWTRVN